MHDLSVWMYLMIFMRIDEKIDRRQFCLFVDIVRVKPPRISISPRIRDRNDVLGVYELS